jgi:hypothetical protein
MLCLVSSNRVQVVLLSLPARAVLRMTSLWQDVVFVPLKVRLHYLRLMSAVNSDVSNSKL